uniref:Secreted protein n=1 Tax=Ixodes scapularis TaxID=6945 RepID=A0A4D5RED4_IXOSC
MALNNFFFGMISWLVQSSVESESRPCAFSVRVCICVAISALALYSALTYVNSSHICSRMSDDRPLTFGLC